MQSIEQRIENAFEVGREASFVIPVHHGDIFLAKRRKPPYPDLFSIIGGKLKQTSTHKTLVTQRAITALIENPFEAACREFCEEMYGDGVYEERLLLADFLTKCDFRLFTLGYIYDEEFDYVCHVSLGCTDEFPEFKLADGEVYDRRVIREIPKEEINPMSRVALSHLKRFTQRVLLPPPYYKFQLAEQIPEWEEIPSKYATWDCFYKK
jgi:8-oxo-dGTP pyrophosphatase MutT (NUDIX family)